jgi:hypothetical protein
MGALRCEIGAVPARTVIENALTALRSVSAPEDVARTMRTTADQIDRAWQRSPWVAGLSGNLVARSELVNMLVGERVLDPFRRALGSAPLRIKRGDVMHYRATRFDGTVEEKTAPEPEPRDDDAKRDREAEEVRGELAAQQTALVTIEHNVPALVRRKLSMWSMWLAPVRWVLGFVHRNAVTAWRQAQSMLESTRRRLATYEDFIAQRDERERAARETYYGGLRLLCGGGDIGKDVREIELSITGLPDNVELVELMGELRASAKVDAVIVVERDALYAPTPDGKQVALGPAESTIAELPDVLSRARALRLARRARDKLGAARAAVEAELDRAELRFRERLQKLSKLSLPLDTAGFAIAQLERVRPMIVASVHAVMEHASTHLGSELAQLGDRWLISIDNTTSSDELKAAIAKIEEEWSTQATRISEEVRMLVMGGAGGVARDLYPETVSVLRSHGLPEEHLRMQKRAPDVSPVQVLPSLATPSAFTLGEKWFTGLFRSLDARKSDIREKVALRASRIRELAAAEMLDAEPKLHAAVGQSLKAQLEAAMELQRSWHAKALTEEHETIAKERRAFATVVANRDAIASAAVQLDRTMAALEAEQPAIAAAAVAAAS